MSYGKGDVDAVVGKMGPPKEAGPPVEDVEDDAAGEDMAVSDFMAAVKSGDTAAGKAALKDFIEICYPELAKGV